MSTYKYYLKNIAQYDNGVIGLELADMNGQLVFDYKPGQYVMISYLNKAGKLTERHAFSIVSAPSQNKSIILGIKVCGKFTQGLLNLKVGAPISVAGPFGNFIFKPSVHKNLVLIAGGIGITPFLSTITYATDKNLDNKLSLIYSTRTIAGANFLNKIKQLESKNPNFKSLLTVTDTDEQVSANTPGVIKQKITGQIIQDFVGGFHDKTFFICGPAAFMEIVKNELLYLGVEEKRIKMEAFSMLDDKKLSTQLKNFLYATGFSAVALAIIFYSVSNSAAMTKKNNSNLGQTINNSASDLQNSTTPVPTTGVSGSSSMVTPQNNNLRSTVVPIIPRVNNSQSTIRTTVPSAGITQNQIPIQTQPTVQPTTNNNQSVPTPITSSSGFGGN